MPKFHQLALQQTFEYQNSRYIKVSPVLAKHIANQTSKLIPRAAEVRILGDGAVELQTTQPTQDTVPLSAVKLACQRMQQNHRELLISLTDQLDKTSLEDVSRALQTTQQAVFDALSINPLSVDSSDR